MNSNAEAAPEEESKHANGDVRGAATDSETSAARDQPALAVPLKPKAKPVLDMTPVNVVQLPLYFTPEVGAETAKIAVTLNMRLLFSTSVSTTTPPLAHSTNRR